MSEQPAATDFDCLEEKAMKYAIAVQARDAIQAQLKYWAAVAVFFGGIAGWFGFSLHRELSDVNRAIADQKARMVEVEKLAREVSATLEARQMDIRDLEMEIADKHEDFDKWSDRIYERATEIDDRAARFRNDSQQALMQLDAATKASKTHVDAMTKDLDAIRGTQQKVEGAATEVQNAAKKLDSVRERAEAFDRSIEGQRQVFRNALLDYVMLTRKAESPELILSTADPRLHYRVIFRTPSDIRRDGFLLTYDVRTCRSNAGSTDCDDVLAQRSYDKTVTYARNRRDWYPLDGTDDGYQYAVDYIFTAKLARNYVTIRIGATDKLLPHLPPGVQMAGGGK